MSSNIQTGDILLFKGTVPIASHLVRWFTNSEYTHVGMAISEGWVYEIDIDRRLAIHPIRNDSYDVFRYKHGLTKDQKQRLLEHALQRAKQNEGYDWLRIIGFALEKLLCFPYAFDRAKEEVCSEIVDYLYSDIMIDLVPNRILGNVTPSHISLSSEIIKVFSHQA